MNLHLHQNRNPICIINLTPYSADVKFIRLLITKNIYYWKKNISISNHSFSRIYNAETIRFFDTPFKYDSPELSPRNKREQFLRDLSHLSTFVASFCWTATCHQLSSTTNSSDEQVVRNCSSWVFLDKVFSFTFLLFYYTRLGEGH